MFGTVQLIDFWIIADLGSTQNLIAEKDFNKLPFKLFMIYRLDVHVVSESGDELTVLMWRVFSLSIGLF